VEEPLLVPVIGRPRPAAAREPRRLQVGSPPLGGAEVARDEVAEGALRVAAGAAEVVEVELVVLDPADAERQVDLQRAELGESLVRGAEIDVGELAEDLVPLRDVALVQLVVGLDRLPRDAVELEEPRLELAGGDLVEVVRKRHAVPPLLSRPREHTLMRTTTRRRREMPHSLPPLPYAYDALEPTIDAKTMEIHHGKHHQAYVDNLNKALEGTPWADRPVEDVIKN